MRSSGVRAEGPCTHGYITRKTRESKYRQQWEYSYNSHSQV